MSFFGHPIFRIKIGLYDRIIVSTVIIIHIYAIWEFTSKHYLRLNNATFLTGFVILTTGIWTFFFIKLAFDQVRKIETLNKELETENIKLLKNEAYKFTYEPLGRALSILNQIERDIDHHGPIGANDEEIGKAIVKQFQAVCGNIAETFTVITGDPKICVSIKIVGEKVVGKDSKVITFTRDEKNSAKRHYKPKDEEILQLTKDTAFEKIWENMHMGNTDKRYYFSNNLPEEPFYKCGNFAVYQQRPYSPKLSKEQRSADWLLPFRSTIVTGVYPNDVNYLIPSFLIGFLCVDSEQINIFTEGPDTDLLTVVADELYNVLKKLRDATKET